MFVLSAEFDFRLKDGVPYHKLLGLCRLVRPVLRRSVPTKTGSIIASQFLAAILRFCRYGKRFFGFASLNEPFEIAPDWFASSERLVCSVPAQTACRRPSRFQHSPCYRSESGPTNDCGQSVMVCHQQRLKRETHSKGGHHGSETCELNRTRFQGKIGRTLQQHRPITAKVRSSRHQRIVSRRPIRFEER